MKVVNLFGSSGAGKSTSALGLAYKLKLLGYKVEYVSEYIKQYVFSGATTEVLYQNKIFGNQSYNLEILRDKGLDFIVTDSPLLLSDFYSQLYSTGTPQLADLVKASFNSYENVNYFLTRTVAFEAAGRLQTEEESDMHSAQLRNYLKDNKIVSKEFPSNASVVDRIMIDLLSNITNN